MKVKILFLFALLGLGTVAIAQFRIGYVNKGTVLPNEVKIYNNEFSAPFNNSLLKVWIGNYLNASEPKYVPYDEVATFDYELTSSNYSTTYIYYTYDARCFELDTIKISRKVNLRDARRVILPCDKEDPKFINCLMEYVGKARDKIYEQDALNVINDLGGKLRDDRFNTEDKEIIQEALSFCIRLYWAEQCKHVVTVGQIVNLYLLHITMKQKIETQIRIQKTPGLQLEGGYFNTKYKFEDYNNDVSYPNWGQFPTYSIRLYKYYDLNKRETYAWPVFYLSTGYMHGPIIYRYQSDTLFNGNGFSYNYFDLKGGWYASANYDRKIFFSVFIEAGVQASFRNTYSVVSDSTKLISFKSTEKFSFEALKLSISGGLVLGVGPVIFRLSGDASGPQHWFSDKNRSFKLRSSRGWTTAVSFPIVSRKKLKYKW